MQIKLNQLEIPKPTVYASQALQLIAEQDTDFNALGKVIMQDPLLASALLRYANSPINRRFSEISNVPTALNLLGLKSVRSAIVSSTLHSLCSDSTSVDNEILQHMHNISTICRLIARIVCQDREYDLEFLGLIHDVGMLVLATNFEEQYQAFFIKSRQDNVALDKLEEAEFGMSHDAVSAHLAHDYRLPKSQIDLLRKYHADAAAPTVDNNENNDEWILSMAHLLLLEITPEGSVIYETLNSDLPSLQKLLNISDNQIDQLRKDIKNIVQV